MQPLKVCNKIKNVGIKKIFENLVITGIIIASKEKVCNNVADNDKVFQ